MRTFEGRNLPRPDEEIVDQGLGFDLGTLLDRRQLLRAVGLGAAAVSLAACSSDPASSARSSGSASATRGEIPEETAGPFPGDGSNGPDALQQTGIVRSDIRSSFGAASGTAEGVPMTLELRLTDVTGKPAPFAGAAVYVWHCDRQGRYSMYSDGVQDQNYLRGVQVADENGLVRFTSAIPACYPGRWPHIHFEVYADRTGISDASNAIATSQVALPADVCRRVYAQHGYEASVAALSQVSLDTDIVFGDDGGASQLADVTGDVANGYTVSLAVKVDASTVPTASDFAGGAPPGGPAGAGAPPLGPPPGGRRGMRSGAPST